MLTKKAIDFINMLGSDIPIEENDLPIAQRGLLAGQIRALQNLKLPSNTDSNNLPFNTIDISGGFPELQLGQSIFDTKPSNLSGVAPPSTFPNSYFPYNIQGQANDYFGDTTNVSGGAQELTLGKSAFDIKSPKLDMLDTALSVLPGAAQIGMGLYNVIEGAKEKKRIKAYDKALKKAQENRFHEARLNDFYYTPYTVGRTTDRLEEGGSIPERYKNMGFTRVGQKKDSTRDGKKWMVLAKKGDDYKVVHGGYEGMEDFTQHRNEKRRDNFWNRMGGRDSAKANDPFSPLYWHKRKGTWQLGGSVDPMDSFMDFYDRDQASKRMADQAIFNTENQQLTQMQQMNEQQRKAGLEGILKGGFSLATSLINPLGSAGKALGGVGKVLGMEKGGWIKDVSESMEREGTKGAFTRQAKKRGMTAQEFARKVLANKENYDTTTVRRANLARTFANMQLGGYYQTIEEMYGGTVDPRQYYYQDGGEAMMMQPEEPDTDYLYSPDFKSPWDDQERLPDNYGMTVGEDPNIGMVYAQSSNMMGDGLGDNSIEQMMMFDMENNGMPTPNDFSSMAPVTGELGLPEMAAKSLPPGYYEQQRTVQGLMPGKEIATQHNNPGNIKYGPFAAKYGAVQGKRAAMEPGLKHPGYFAIFPTIEAGLEAHRNLLRKGTKYKNADLDSALRTWSYNSYGANIVPHLRGKKVSELTDAEFNEVMMAQHKIESPEMYRILYGRK